MNTTQTRNWSSTRGGGRRRRNESGGRRRDHRHYQPRHHHHHHHYQQHQHHQPNQVYYQHIDFEQVKQQRQNERNVRENCKEKPPLFFPPSEVEMPFLEKKYEFDRSTLTQVGNFEHLGTATHYRRLCLSTYTNMMRKWLLEFWRHPAELESAKLYWQKALGNTSGSGDDKCAWIWQKEEKLRGLHKPGSSTRWQHYAELHFAHLLRLERGSRFNVKLHTNALNTYAKSANEQDAKIIKFYLQTRNMPHMFQPENFKQVANQFHRLSSSTTTTTYSDHANVQTNIQQQQTTPIYQHPTTPTYQHRTPTYHSVDDPFAP